MGQNECYTNAYALQHCLAQWLGRGQTKKSMDWLAYWQFIQKEDFNRWLWKEYPDAQRSKNDRHHDSGWATIWARTDDNDWPSPAIFLWWSSSDNLQTTPIFGENDSKWLGCLWSKTSRSPFATIRRVRFRFSSELVSNSCCSRSKEFCSSVFDAAYGGCANRRRQQVRRVLRRREQSQCRLNRS